MRRALNDDWPYFHAFVHQRGKYGEHSFSFSPLLFERIVVRIPVGLAVRLAGFPAPNLFMCIGVCYNFEARGVAGDGMETGFSSPKRKSENVCVVGPYRLFFPPLVQKGMDEESETLGCETLRKFLLVRRGSSAALPPSPHEAIKEEARRFDARMSCKLPKLGELPCNAPVTSAQPQTTLPDPLNPNELSKIRRKGCSEFLCCHLNSPTNWSLASVLSRDQVIELSCFLIGLYLCFNSQTCPRLESLNF